MSDHESERLSALRQLDLLDTPPSESFDRITRMASQIFGLPISAVSLTDHDRQWFKSRVGVDHWSIPRDKAPCAQVAESTEILVIPDLLADECYRHSVLAQNGIRFYAGAPLTTADGFGLGAMCVLGAEPRTATDAEMSALNDLAAMVMSQIEMQHAFGRVDPVSRLPNRNQFIEDAQDFARDRDPQERRLGVLFDLVRTQELESALRTLGPSFIDGLVSRAAKFLQEGIRDGRKIYHVAATQFAFFAPEGAEEETYIPLVVEHLRRYERRNPSGFLTNASIGISPFRWGELDAGKLIRTMHSAAQDARASESKVGVYSPAQDEVHARRFQLISDFGRALEAGDELRLVYQPRIDIESGACTGAEALLRWRHPELGEISPGEFVPLIEQTSMAKGMTRWVLRTALKQLAAWQISDPAFQVSVNVSASNLHDADFAASVRGEVARAGVGDGTLELEVTESAMMQGAAAMAQLDDLSKGGVRIAIDDFGTGYSNFSYLQALPASIVKIDQSFVRDIVDDPVKRTLVDTMTNMSHALGYRVVAEGVETSEAFAALVQAGCDEAQGYYFARPMPADELPGWIDALIQAQDTARAELDLRMSPPELDEQRRRG